MATPPPVPAPPANPLMTATGQSYNAAQLITMSCHALANVVFTAPDPKPSWFDGLAAELKAAQDLANQWIGTLGIDVTKSIPMLVLDYGPQFTSTANTILEIVQQHPNATGKDNQYVLEIKTLIVETLMPQLKSIYGSIDNTSTQLQTWGTSIQAAHNNLVSGAVNIQSLETDLQADISKMNNAIANLHTEIDAENKAIAYSAMAVGIGIFGLICGIALAFVTFGAGLVVAGIGAAAIVGGAVSWGIMQAKINSQFDEIAADQKELAQDQRQIVALQGLSMASNQAIGNLQVASTALSGLRTQWAVFEGEIQGVIDKLDEAEEAIATIVQGVFTQAAVTEWNEAMATATALVNATFQSEAQTLPMDSQQAA
jgi:hypothetical protein